MLPGTSLSTGKIRFGELSMPGECQYAWSHGTALGRLVNGGTQKTFYGEGLRRTASFTAITPTATPRRLFKSKRIGLEELITLNLSDEPHSDLVSRSIVGVAYYS